MFIVFVGGSWLWNGKGLEHLPRVVAGHMLGDMVGPFLTEEDGVAYLKANWPLEDPDTPFVPDEEYAALVFPVEAPDNWVSMPFEDYSVETILGVAADRVCEADGHIMVNGKCTRCDRREDEI